MVELVDKLLYTGDTNACLPLWWLPHLKANKHLSVKSWKAP
jgi:hypothetical protein